MISNEIRLPYVAEGFIYANSGGFIKKRVQ